MTESLSLVINTGQKGTRVGKVLYCESKSQQVLLSWGERQRQAL